MQKVLVLCPAPSGWPDRPLGMAYVLACLERASIPFAFLDVATTPNGERKAARLLKGTTDTAMLSGVLLGFHRFFRQ